MLTDGDVCAALYRMRHTPTHLLDRDRGVRTSASGASKPMTSSRNRLLLQAAEGLWGFAQVNSVLQRAARQPSCQLGLQLSQLSLPAPSWQQQHGVFAAVAPISLNSVKSFATDATDSMALTTAVLQQVQVNKLREELRDEAERQLCIPYKELVARAISCGAAKTEQEAEELCSVLQRTGLVLRHHNVVYLRAEEISEMVMMLLPGGREDAELKLKKVESELSAMEPLHRQAERSARVTTDMILGVGACILFLQLVGFAYLTWWELSWDVMEPFGYIIQLFYSFVAYMYFMSTSGKVFDLGPFREFWNERFKKQSIQKFKFDEDRYNYLIKLQERYKRHLQHHRVT